MKRFVMAVSLVCALALTTLAGQVPTVGYAEQVSDAALSGLLTVLSLLVV